MTSSPSYEITQCPQTPGRKRRRTDDTELSPARRRRLVSPQDANTGHSEDKTKNQVQNDCKKPPKETKPTTILLSSPSDVSDLSVTQEVRNKQAEDSGLPDLLTLPTRPEPNQVTGLSVTEIKDKQKTKVDIMRRSSALRPPLSRRRVLGRRPRIGVGIVRWRSESCAKSGWDEETDTDESEDPTASPCREEVSGGTKGKCDGTTRAAMNSQGCECCDDCKGVVDVKPLEESVGSSVLPIDPSQSCFDYNDTEDLWQLRSPSPDGAFVPTSFTEVEAIEQVQSDDTKTTHKTTARGDSNATTGCL